MAGSTASRPHVLLISIDTLRADALSTYGAPAGSAPALDAFAKESIIFENAIAASNYTAPSHATMLTGASPPVHGVINTLRSAPRKIPKSIPTIAERLAGVGYATGANTAAGYVTKPFGFDRGFEVFTEKFEATEKKIKPALDWFQSLPAGKSGFYFLHTYETHAPYLPKQAEARSLSTKYPKSDIPNRLAAIFALPEEQQLPRGHGILFHEEKKFTENDIECLRELYRMTVLSVDAAIGSLLQDLRAKGILKDTIVIITSDHGEEFREHKMLQHEQVFDEIIKIPLLIRLPDARRGGVRVATTFPAADLTPTILELLSLPPSSHIDGKSRKQLVLGGKTTEVNDRAFAFGFRSEINKTAVVRTPALKLLEHKGENGRTWDEIYNLKADPKESEKLPSAKIPHAATLIEMLKLQRGVWAAMFEHHAPNAESGLLDAKSLEELNGIGYIK
ncbi:MAG: sulfatase [Planctomycetota bacterium]